MDSIYSRKRIKIPKVKGFYTNNKNAKKFFSIFIIILIAISTFYNLYKSINPIFDTLCIEKARSLGTYIMNNASNIVLDDIDYKNIVSIEEVEGNRVLKTDVVIINKIASDIALEAEKQFKELENEKIEIPIGALTGNKYLAGSGPNINIQVIPTGNILTEIKNEFESTGINQTVYRIYLELTCKVSIVSQYKTIEDEIVNQVLLVETVIVGEVPNSYYNLEGMKQEDVTEVIQ
ncbi:MAG: sporulation protein YunB [Clostridia bacterium]|nr:sporulation protein YunB [Clostridia bacterium]